MTDIRHARRELWLIAQNFIATLFNVFGAPEEIAERHTFLRREWTLIAKWLRAGEALLRQLLLIEAAALPKPETRAITRKPRARKPKTMSFDADAPDTWRVSFRCVLPMDRRLPVGKMPALRLSAVRQRRGTRNATPPPERGRRRAAASGKGSASRLVPDPLPASPFQGEVRVSATKPLPLKGGGGERKRAGGGHKCCTIPKLRG